MDLDKQPEEDSKKRVMKIIVVGEMGTGKTSLIRQYVHGAFSEFYKSTIGVDFAHKKIDLPTGDVVDLQLWDISGQERFASVTHMYYNEAVAAMVVFDLISPSTLCVAKIWKKDIDEKVMTSEEKPIPCLLVGNKVDLVGKEGPDKSDEEMDKFCEENGFMGFIRTSARQDTNVTESVEKILHYVLEHNIQPYRPKELAQCVKLDDTKKKEKNEKSGCC
ncbi:Ras family protein [Trichomonas vaginalis G3]|uniref:Ras-related protein Rab n=1 Tax=Trichomonas vaginalis (strain ATCC PRA-98 / G3) TaxID=412133 RepID=A2DXY3_TRIV3|nr:BLOC-2 complex binding [Trichomonas vaginalis G3]EAY14719.1 Ras family protein [Trichomonas vaginalis G3]KAI5487910.1 BLOC-2 complex binding [Trichomonas vaginalis G3]|eukprot:XP_001326942.1 Ras family protein [Trichomonas vaginalis G3]